MVDQSGKTLGCLSFSVLFHASCAVALVAAHQIGWLDKAGDRLGTAIEVALAAGGSEGAVSATPSGTPDATENIEISNTSAQAQETSARPEPQVEDAPAVAVLPSKTKKPLPSAKKKMVAAKKARSRVKESPPTVLPAKTVDDTDYAAQNSEPDMNAVEVVDDPNVTEAKNPQENENVEPEELAVAKQALAVAQNDSADEAFGEEDSQDFSSGADRAEDAAEPPANSGVDESGSGGEAGAGEGQADGAGDDSASTRGSGGGSVQDARNLMQVPGNQPPVYPVQDRLAGNQGVVQLSYQVGANGQVSDVKVIQSSGHVSLDREAVRAVSQYKYVPGQAGLTVHPVIFRLNGPQKELQSGLRRSARTE